jgi:hypothetical protein
LYAVPFLSELTPIQVSRERKEVAKQLSVWGEECDDDVSDVTDKLGVLIFEVGELEDNYIGLLHPHTPAAGVPPLR